MSESVPALPRKPGRPKNRVQVQCPMCPVIFETIPAEQARGGGRYCSAECRAKARSEGRRAAIPAKPRQPPVERLCEVCRATFRVFPHRATSARPARYCSVVCRKAPPAAKAAAKAASR